MTPADRAKITEMLRERLPEGWRVSAVNGSAILYVDGPAGPFAHIHGKTLFLGVGAQASHSGRGWHTRLVADVIKVVQAQEDDDGTA